MINRGILARIAAKAGGKKKVKVKTTAIPIQVKQILVKNPETGKVEDIFKNIEEAVANGFNEPNIKKALKAGTKYKGHLWGYSE